eukprot:1377125-Alexandrium_andersonii.AAC.1
MSACGPQRRATPPWVAFMLHTALDSRSWLPSIRDRSKKSFAGAADMTPCAHTPHHQCIGVVCRTR